MSATVASPAAPLPIPGTNTRRDWKGAFIALRRLLADGNDTVQVFRIDASAPTQSRDAVALRKEMKASSCSRALAAA